LRPSRRAAEVEHHDVEFGSLEHRPRGGGGGHALDGKALGTEPATMPLAISSSSSQTSTCMLNPS